MFNTVQTATANNPLGPAEGHFCMSVLTFILHRQNVQWKYEFCIQMCVKCVFTDMHY